VRRKANESREKRDQVIGDSRDHERVLVGRIATECGDLDGRRGLAARDGEGARLVRARDASGSLGAIEASALRRPRSFIAELRISDPGSNHRDQEVLRD
jgi:hypothetical protein